MENLSVNEMGGDASSFGLRCSDVAFSTRQDPSKRYQSFINESRRTDVDFRVGVKNGMTTLTVIGHSETKSRTEHNNFCLTNVDLDKLIEFLQESKQFVSEELVYQKLTGVR